MGSPKPLASRYAGIVLDIDGVCVRGKSTIPGAPETVDELRKLGVGLAFATNNASRTPAAVADHLRDAGFIVDASEVVTSGQAAARLLAPGTRCLVIGMEGVREPLIERGCVITPDYTQADAVVVGIDTDLTYEDLALATLAIGRGARFVGTNPDPSFPSERGQIPGNGAILAALRTATGVQAEVAGKPEAPLFEAAADRMPEGPLLMVGDRLDTDVQGAAELGWDTALALTGSTHRDMLAAATSAPTYVLETIADLLELPTDMAG